MNEAERQMLAAMRGGAAAKLAWHRQMMAGSAAWLDEVAGRRAMADQITSDLEAFIARADRDMEAEAAQT